MKTRFLTLAIAIIAMLSNFSTGVKAQDVNREMLDMIIPSLNAQCPQDVGNGITILKYDLQMDYLIFYMTSEYNKPDSNTGDRVDDIFRESMMMMFTQESAAPFANILIENGLGFEAYITYADGEKAVILVTPREFANAIRNREELSPEDLYTNWLASAQKTLPINEGGVITTQLYDENGYIVYVMENDHIAETFAPLDNEQFTSAMKIGLNSAAQTNGSVYKIFANAGRGIIWKFKTSAGVKIGTVTNAELREMLDL